MNKTKLYCYVDETGQDTKGELFLVVVILKEIADLALLERRLEEIEEQTEKKKLKWRKTSHKAKRQYLEKLMQVRELRNSVFYGKYQDSKEYSKLTSLTIAKAVLYKQLDDYLVTVIIDGLNNKEREVVREELKKLKIKYRKIRGMKDEQSVFLRLADAMAGFLRDAFEGEPYTKEFMKALQTNRVLIEN